MSNNERKQGEEHLWTEKYRPKTIDECVLPPRMKKVFKAIIKSGDMQNLLLCSPIPGTGKTTTAKALCNEMGLDTMLINCSEDSGIDTLRGRIRQFASSVSLSGDLKVVIMDEADYLNASSTQPALRGFIEEFSNNCRFIFTCNYKHRIIEAIHSRCSVIEYSMTSSELQTLCGQFMKRLRMILDNEGVTYDPAVIAKLITTHAPDWRRVISECQRYGSTGEININVLEGGGDASIEALVEILKKKDFKAMRVWVAESSAGDPTDVLNKLYKSAYTYMEPSTIPAAVLILADYSYKNAFVVDKELNMAACLTELMGSVTWQ